MPEGMFRPSRSQKPMVGGGAAGRVAGVRVRGRLSGALVGVGDDGQRERAELDVIAGVERRPGRTPTVNRHGGRRAARVAWRVEKAQPTDRRRGTREATRSCAALPNTKALVVPSTRLRARKCPTGERVGDGDTVAGAEEVALAQSAPARAGGPATGSGGGGPPGQRSVPDAGHLVVAECVRDGRRPGTGRRS